MAKKYDIVNVIDSDQFTYQLYADMAGETMGTAEVSGVVEAVTSEELIFEFDIVGFVPEHEEQFLYITSRTQNFTLSIGNGIVSLGIGISTGYTVEVPVSNYNIHFKLSVTPLQNNSYLNGDLILANPSVITLDNFESLEFYRQAVNGEMANVVFSTEILPEEPEVFFTGTISGYSVPVPVQSGSPGSRVFYAFYPDSEYGVDGANATIVARGVDQSGFIFPNADFGFGTGQPGDREGGFIVLSDIYSNQINDTYTAGYLNTETFSRIKLMKGTTFLGLFSYKSPLNILEFHDEQTNAFGDLTNIGSLSGVIG